MPAISRPGNFYIGRRAGVGDLFYDFCFASNCSKVKATFRCKHRPNVRKILPCNCHQSHTAAQYPDAHTPNANEGRGDENALDPKTFLLFTAR